MITANNPLGLHFKQRQSLSFQSQPYIMNTHKKHQQNCQENNNLNQIYRTAVQFRHFVYRQIHRKQLKDKHLQLFLQAGYLKKYLLSFKLIFQKNHYRQKEAFQLQSKIEYYLQKIETNLVFLEEQHLIKRDHQFNEYRDIYRQLSKKTYQILNKNDLAYMWAEIFLDLMSIFINVSQLISEKSQTRQKKVDIINKSSEFQKFEHDIAAIYDGNLTKNNIQKQSEKNNTKALALTQQIKKLQLQTQQISYRIIDQLQSQNKDLKQKLKKMQQINKAQSQLLQKIKSTNQYNQSFLFSSTNQSFSETDNKNKINKQIKNPQCQCQGQEKKDIYSKKKKKTQQNFLIEKLTNCSFENKKKVKKTQNNKKSMSSFLSYRSRNSAL